MLLSVAGTFLLFGSLKAEGEVSRPPGSAEALYDPNPSHLWNRLHRAFFVRPDAGDNTQNADSVDPPLWLDTSEFLKTGSSHDNAIDLLDEFLSNEGEALCPDPVKRAMLQHDLWAVFDWSAQSKAGGEEPASHAERNLAKLRNRLAEAIRRLALSEKELATLPNNLADAVAAKTFSQAWDKGDPQTPFLPPDLLNPDGPWVCVRGAFPGPGAPVHAEYYRERSPFLVFVRLPEGREATMKYLSDLNEASKQNTGGEADGLPQFPVGTETALLRSMPVIDTSGRIQVTPLVQTLQMRVYRQVGTEVRDHKNSQSAVKFRLERGALFAGQHGGLVPVSADEPLRISLLQRADFYDRQNGHAGIKTVMKSCIACHSCGGATVHSFFTYKQNDWVPGAQSMPSNRLRLIATNAETESERSIKSKMKRYDWGLLKGLLEKPPAASPVTAAN